MAHYDPHTGLSVSIMYLFITSHGGQTEVAKTFCIHIFSCQVPLE